MPADTPAAAWDRPGDDHDPDRFDTRPTVAWPDPDGGAADDAPVAAVDVPVAVDEPALTWDTLAPAGPPPTGHEPAQPEPAAATVDDLADLFGDEPGSSDTPPGTPVPAPARAAVPVPVAPVGLRWDRLETLYGAVDRMLAVVNHDGATAMALQELKLTRDRDVDAAQRARFRALLEPLLAASGQAVIANPTDIGDVFNLAYAEVIGLGPLDELWWDDDITEILVDSPDLVYIERSGHLELTPVRFRDLTHAQNLARTLSTKISDRAVNPANPLVTAELPGARVTFCYGPAVVRSGISITIRKFRPLLGMRELLGFGSLSTDMAAFLADAVAARATILVSGGTGSGKTSMINALSQFIPDHERIVTIEDAFELQLTNRFVVSLQTKERASGDDQVHITQADLLVNALRMRPDRIIVGEIREPSGAQVMLQASGTGHDGSLTTIHANTADTAVNYRLAGLLRTATGMSDDVAVREVASAIDLVVQVTRRAGRRFVSEISAVDVTGIDGRRIVPAPLFTGDLDADGTVAFRNVGTVGDDTVLRVKFAEAGIDPDRWEARP